jgi:hypothetical protein
MNPTRRSILGLVTLPAVLLTRRASADTRHPVDLTGNTADVYTAGGLSPVNRIAGARLYVVDPVTGKKMGFVWSADTGAGTLTQFVTSRNTYLLSPQLGRYDSTRGQNLPVVTEKRDYDIVDRRTGETLHRVRWV